MVMGILRGKMTPVTVLFMVTKIEKNTTQKSHTHKESHCSLHTETNLGPWTQTYTINHNTASSWNYSTGHIILLASYFYHQGPILIPSWNLESVCVCPKTSEKVPNFPSTELFLPKWMILDYIPFSHPGRATWKCRREDTVRRRSQSCSLSFIWKWTKQ